MDAFEGRREPTLLEDLPSRRGEGSAVEEVGFTRRARRGQERAGRAMWATAVVLGLALVGSSLVFPVVENAAWPYVVGAGIGALLLPMLAVGIASLWGDGPNQRKGVRTFIGSCVVLLSLSAATNLTERGYAQRWLNKDRMSADDFRAQAERCARLHDLNCQEINWRDVVRVRPEDSLAAARLGMVLNQRGKHEEAVVQFKRSLDLGAGAYDLFAYLADSYEKLGQLPQAIEWSYKALSVVPTLVDVRERLAGVLVRSQRPYEALSLLQGYDSQLEARDQQPRFVAQRISIETAIAQTTEQDAERMSLRLPLYAGHFFAPVAVGTGKARPFMVDTGASLTSLAESLLRDSQAKYRIVDPMVKMTTADGRKVAAKAIVLDTMKVGPFELKNVPAVVCAGCVSLLGQASLSKFDMQSSRVQGVDFLLLSPRDVPRAR
ncbi:UNVERIFIED_ORG: clan AA aspartic protease (TIGR02281 family) [Variovorax guangxiensis]